MRWTNYAEIPSSLYRDVRATMETVDEESGLPIMLEINFGRDSFTHRLSYKIYGENGVGQWIHYAPTAPNGLPCLVPVPR